MLIDLKIKTILSIIGKVKSLKDSKKYGNNKNNK